MGSAPSVTAPAPVTCTRTGSFGAKTSAAKLAETVPPATGAPVTVPADSGAYPAALAAVGTATKAAPAMRAAAMSFFMKCFP